MKPLKIETIKGTPFCAETTIITLCSQPTAAQAKKLFKDDSIVLEF